jgi:hypothetical protein
MSNNNADTQFQDTLDKIEVGLEAFEKLLAFSKGMSKKIENYDVFDDVDESYKEEGPNIVKDFIKVGLDFVRGHPDADNKSEFNMKVNDTSVTELSQFESSHDTTPQVDIINAPANKTAEVSDDCPTEPSGQPEVGFNMVDNSIEKDEIFHLSQVDTMDTTHRTPLQKEVKLVPEEDKARVVEKIQVEKVQSSKKKKIRKKKKRQERLLNYQENLMKTCGLPPSRLMEEKRPEHHVSSAGDVRKNLSSEFDQHADFDPGPSTTDLA